jgi:RimJ/RimL family protein N-acetyltransferase
MSTGSPATPAPLEPVEIAAGPLQLRPLEWADAAELLPLLSDPEVTRWMGSGPASVPEAEEWIDRRVAESTGGTALCWTIRTAVGGHLAGTVNLHHVDAEQAVAEVGYTVAPAYRRRGVAQAALNVACNYGFGALSLARICAYHAVGNTASCAVMERGGFLAEGELRQSYVVNGARVDEHLHARLATDPRPIIGPVRLDA